MIGRAYKKYANDSEVKQARGLEAWRNLYRDRVIELASMMPDMDTEVALKIIEQLPEFTSFALQTLEFIEKRHESSLRHNAASQERVHNAFGEVREVLKGELDTDLTPEQRTHIYGLLMETANREFQKDSENKEFIEGLFQKAAVVAAALVASAVVFVGGRVMVQTQEGLDGSRLPDA